MTPPEQFLLVFLGTTYRQLSSSEAKAASRGISGSSHREPTSRLMDSRAASLGSPATFNASSIRQSSRRQTAMARSSCSLVRQKE